MAVDRERLKWADSGPSGTAWRRTGVRAIADVQLRARRRLHRDDAEAEASEGRGAWSTERLREGLRPE